MRPQPTRQPRAAQPADRDWNPAAHDAVLAWCRAHNDGRRIPGMRNGRGPQAPACRVVDLARWDSAVIAEGGDWLEVATALGIEVTP